MRLFIAIPFSDDVKSALLDSMEDLKAKHVFGNYTREENLHLTLAFLGEFDDPSAVIAAMKDLSFPPIPLTLHGAGRFGDLYWVGLAHSNALLETVRTLRRTLDARGIRYDHKKFKPHITVLRRAVSAEPVRIKVMPASMTADRICLMSSSVVGGKRTYTELFSVRAW